MNRFLLVAASLMLCISPAMAQTGLHYAAADDGNGAARPEETLLPKNETTSTPEFEYTSAAAGEFAGIQAGAVAGAPAGTTYQAMGIAATPDKCECGCGSEECVCEDCASPPPAEETAVDEWDSTFEPVEDLDFSWSDFGGVDLADSYRPRFRLTSAHWSGFGLHYSGMVGGLDKLSIPDNYRDLEQSAQSIGVTINLIDVALPISRNLGLFSGIGLEINNFRFSQNVGLKQENGLTVVDRRYIDEGIDLRKSKLRTGYINIPLMLEFQFGRNNDFFINAGVVGGIRIGGMTKIKAKDPQLKGTFKQWSNVSLRNFHYGYSVNLGYDKYAISASYYPQSIFKNTFGPRVEQVNIGISIMR